MTGFRWLSLVSAVSAALRLWTSADVAAQGRGKNSNRGNSGGPAFCRSGAGHPVHGWEWCRQRGWDRAQGQSVRGTAVPRNSQGQLAPYANRDPYANRPGRQVNDPAFDSGYADGYEKGLDDGQDRRDRNPTRHAWYRSADRNYDSRYGSRAAYANVYREGFRSGYDQGFNDGERYGDSGGFRWPF
jgi:hypothetical protein